MAGDYVFVQVLLGISDYHSTISCLATVLDVFITYLYLLVKLIEWQHFHFLRYFLSRLPLTPLEEVFISLEQEERIWSFSGFPYQGNKQETTKNFLYKKNGQFAQFGDTKKTYIVMPIFNP